MVQKIKQPNLMGNIGQNFAAGLGGQLPKEVERYRLSNALQNVQGMQNATPFEQFSALAPYMKDNPQLLQNTTELLRQQGIRNAYAQSRPGRLTGQQEQPGQVIPENDPRNVNFMNQVAQQPQQVSPGAQPNQIAQGKQIIPSDFASRAAEVASAQPAARENPLQKKFLPPPVWNREMHEREINNAYERGLARTFDEADAYANRQKQIYEAAPEAERARLNYQKEIDQETDNLFDSQLATRLEKSKDGTFKEVPGDLQLEMKKQARNKVATGQMTPDQAAEFYSKGAHDLARTQSEFKTQANRDLFDRIAPGKKDAELKRLKTMGEQFADYGASEMFYNMLQNQNKDANGNKEGFGLSPGSAALIAFPRSAAVSKIVKESKIPLTTFDPVKSSQASKALAEKVLHGMSSRDSILAIAKELQDKHPLGFDQVAFFDYIADHPELWKYNPRLQREMQKRESDMFPNWGDIALFPVFSKTSAAHMR